MENPPMTESTSRYDLFVCHAREDASWVEGYLLDALQKAGVRCHTQEAFELGEAEVVALEEAVNNSRKTLLILSPYFLTDKTARWVEKLATTRGVKTETCPVIPLRLREVVEDRVPVRLRDLPVGIDATLPEKWP